MKLKIYSRIKSLTLGLAMMITFSACNQSLSSLNLIEVEEPSKTQEQIEIPIILPLKKKETSRKNIQKKMPMYLHDQNSSEKKYQKS